MTIPGWILDSFAGLMLTVATVSAARLAVARPWSRNEEDTGADADLAHLLMGIAMAGTLTAGLRTLPDAAWEAVFALLAVWFADRVVREVRGHGSRLLADGHRLPHLVHSVAMLYMFLALTAPRAASGEAGMGGLAVSGTAMPALRLPTLALLFAFVLIGFVVSDLDRLSAPAALRRYRPSRAGFVPAGAALAGAATATARAGSPSPAEAALTAAGTATPPAGSALAATATRPAGPVAQAASPDHESSGAAHPGALRSGTAASAPGIRAMPGRLLTPAVARGCRIAMGVTMAFMLVIMI